MKSKEELNALKEEVETLSRKLHELTDEDLAQVSGGNMTCNPMDHGCGTADFDSTLPFYQGEPICSFCRNFISASNSCKKHHDNPNYVKPPYGQAVQN